MLQQPQHEPEDELNHIEWKMGCLAAMKSAAEETGNDEMVNTLDVLEQIMDHYQLTVSDVCDREIYSWAMPMNHLLLLEECLAEIALWLDPEDSEGVVNPAWLAKKLDEELEAMLEDAAE